MGTQCRCECPTPSLMGADMQVKQSLELRVKESELAVEPGSDGLEALLAKLTLENQHGVALEGPAMGAEIW